MLKLYRGLRPYAGQLALLLLLLCGQTFSLLFLPNMMSMIVNKGVIAGDIRYIITTGLIMLLISLGGSACAIGVGYFASKAGVGLCTDTRAKLFRHINKFTLAEFDRFGAASLTTRSTNDVMQVQTFTIMMFRVIILAPVMCAGAIILSFLKSTSLALVLTCCIPVIILVLVLVLRKVLPVFRSQQSKLDRTNLILRENLTGVRVIRAFTAEDREKDRFAEANEDMTASATRSQTLVSTLMPIMMFVVNFCTVLIVWIGGNQVAAGTLLVGDLMAFIQYLTLILYALIMMSLILAIFPRANVCANRINEVMDTAPAIQPPAVPKSPETRAGMVEFRDVALRYEEGGREAVKNISFTAHPGKTTALIGATGSGKSSVICLIPRLRDATGGAVLIDGVNVKDYDLKELRSRVGYVPQKSNLFSGTIRSNIAYEKPQLTDGEVEKAAQIAQAHTFILEKKLGYDDPIAQGGTNVSGGQRQRLAIARALATRADVYVFDDSFSALDFKTDAALRKGIRENYQNATVIIVAQRVNTIMGADEILVLDKGEIVGRGTHGELLESCEIYSEIAKTQLA